jgi:hypothetical protein
MRIALFSTLLVVVVGCSSSTQQPPADVVVDSGNQETKDTGTGPKSDSGLNPIPDSGTTTDSGITTDGGVADSGDPDTCTESHGCSNGVCTCGGTGPNKGKVCCDEAVAACAAGVPRCELFCKVCK